MDAPRENVDLTPSSLAKKAGILALAGVLSSVEAEAATVVDGRFSAGINTVSAIQGLDETYASAQNGLIHFTGIDVNSGEERMYEMQAGGTPSVVSLPGNYYYLSPLSATEFFAPRSDRPGADFLNRDPFTGAWSIQGAWAGPALDDDHADGERTAGSGDVFVYLKAVPSQYGSDQLILNINGLESVLAEVPDGTGHPTLNYGDREIYVVSNGDIVKYTWTDGAPMTPVSAWSTLTTPVVTGAFAPSYNSQTGELHFTALGASDLDIFSIQKLPEALPTIAPTSIEGEDGTDLSRRSAEIDCTEVPTYTVTVAIDGDVTSSEGLALVEGAVSTPLSGRIVDGKLVVDVPTAGMPMNAECNVIGTAIGEAGRAPFSVTLVAVPECEVSLDDEETTVLDTAPETGEVVIDGDAGTLAYAVDFLAKFADGEVTADVKGSGSIVYGVDESGQSFLRSNDGIKRFLSGTDAAMVKFAPAEGSVTIKDAHGNVLIVLNAGEEAVVSIDYITPEVDTDTPGTDTPDDTVDTTTDEEDEKGKGCDQTGGTPNGVAAGVLAAVMAALRRKRM